MKSLRCLSLYQCFAVRVRSDLFAPSLHRPGGITITLLPQNRRSHVSCNSPERTVMLEPIMSSLNNDRVILASSSPRRQEIMASLGLKFEVIPSLYEEDLNPEHFETPGEFVIATAANKVAELEARLAAQGEAFSVIIGADTMVYSNKQIFGKPKTPEQAKQYLQMLSGKTHEVFTGVCVKARGKEVTFSERTGVTFGALPEAVIDAYIASGEPMDKAGGYGIQGKAASLISGIEGDYFNVVGLPMHRLCLALLGIYQATE